MAERRLAAIMFTDIVGYSTMMQHNEASAIASANRHESVVTEQVLKENGRLLHFYGDGSLSIFNSATQAIRSAIKTQISLQDEPGVPLRIGLNIGEVLIDGQKIYGDGVNIASRIESSGVAGSVLLSKNVFEKIRNRSEFPCQSLGRFAFKNIAQDLELYALSHPLLTVPLPGDLKGKRNEENERTIAVIPFRNLSDDPEQIYYCEGICEDITHALSQIPDMKVASISSVKNLWNKFKNGDAVGQQLGVAIICEGSVRRVGDQLRINVQLSDLEEGYHIWSSQFNGSVQDIFEMQDKITQNIVNFLEPDQTVTKSPGEKPKNSQAYDAYLQAKFHFNKRSQKHNLKAMQLLERALSLDPEFALGYATLARVNIEQFFTYDPKEQWEKRAYVALEKARALDEDLADIYLAKGNLLWTRENGFPHADAIKAYIHAIKKDPMLSEAYNELSRVTWHVGLLDLAYAASLKTTQLDPYFTDGHFRFGWLEIHRGNLDAALALLRRVPEGSLAPSTDVLISQCLLFMDRKEEAFNRLDSIPQSLHEDADYCGMKAVFQALKGDGKGAEFWIQEAIKYGQRLGHFHHITCNIAEAYSILQELPKAIKWIRYTIQDGFPCYPWLISNPCFENLREQPEFNEILESTRVEMESYRTLTKDFIIE